MQMLTTPGNPLQGTLTLPGDKSISHRAALFAALAEGESRIENLLVAGVTRVMLQALADLGIPWELDGTTLTLQGQGFRGLDRPDEPIFLNCGNSGTTLRLLAGALAALGVPATLDGSPGLRRRPMKRIVAPLQAMGVPVQASPENTAPLRLGARRAGQRLRALDYTLSVASAQVKSCLLLAALDADGPTTLSEPDLSRDHTERMLRSMGVLLGSFAETRSEPQSTYFVTRIMPPDPPQLAPLHLAIPGDISSAAFPIVGALITLGSEITLEGVGLNPTRTGLLDALRSMGAEIEVTPRGESHGEPFGDLRVRYAPLRGTQISGPLVVRMIDEFPAFAVAAAYAHGKTTISGAEELRHKESDRISALCNELHRLDVDVEETPDGFVIHGGRPVRGGTVKSHGDHRLAMALSVAGLASQSPVLVQGAEIVSESFPSFTDKLKSLGADIKSET
jgi:3-phosphoshikimate 1-carboxyvinyltransferase